MSGREMMIVGGVLLGLAVGAFFAIQIILHKWLKRLDAEYQTEQGNEEWL